MYVLCSSIMVHQSNRDKYTQSLSRSHSSVLRLVDCHLFYLPVIHAPLAHSGADAGTVVLYTEYRESERESKMGYSSGTLGLSGCTPISFYVSVSNF